MDQNETILLDREPIVVDIVGFLGDENVQNSCTVKGSPEQAVMKRAETCNLLVLLP